MDFKKCAEILLQIDQIFEQDEASEMEDHMMLNLKSGNFL